MNKILATAATFAVIANQAYCDTSYKTIGDMKPDELTAIMKLRAAYDDMFGSAQSARNKLGNAMVASIVGTVLEAGALTTGIIKETRHSKTENAAQAELEKLSDMELAAQFDARFKKDCEDDKKKNPTAYKSENGEDISCETLAQNFHVKNNNDKDADRAAMIAYMTDGAQNPDDKSQIFNWVRMGASAGGAIAGIVSLSVMGSVQDNLDDASDKAAKLQAAVNDFNSIAMQARVEKRTNNPMMEIMSNCNNTSVASKLSDTAKKIKTAKTIQTVGVVAGAGSAVTSGIQNINAVGEKKGLNLASNITAGAAAVASGVGLAFAAISKKSIDGAMGSLDSCMEYLWWDENGHGYESKGDEDCAAMYKAAGYTANSAAKFGADCRITLCEPGFAIYGGNSAFPTCSQCDFKPGSVGEWKEPGKTCYMKSCADGHQLDYYNCPRVANGQDSYTACALPCGDGKVKLWMSDGYGECRDSVKAIGRCNDGTPGSINCNIKCPWSGDGDKEQFSKFSELYRIADKIKDKSSCEAKKVYSGGTEGVGYDFSGWAIHGVYNNPTFTEACSRDAIHLQGEVSESQFVAGQVSKLDVTVNGTLEEIEFFPYYGMTTGYKLCADINTGSTLKQTSVFYWDAPNNRCLPNYICFAGKCAMGHDMY